MPIAYDKCNGLRHLCQKEQVNRDGLIKIDGLWLQLEYNTFRPHSSLNYRHPAPEEILHCEKRNGCTLL
jgi:hypothetical protein